MHHTEFGITGKTNFCSLKSFDPEVSSCKSSRATEIGDPIDFVVCSSSLIAKVCNYASGTKDAHPGGTGKKPW